MSELSVLSDLRELIKFVYELELPSDEKFGLQSQIRRASVSVALNIREGNVFEGKNKVRFFKQALGSLVEVDECMNIIKSLGWVVHSCQQILDVEDTTQHEIMCVLEYFRDEHYWLCLNKLKKLITSINSMEEKK